MSQEKNNMSANEAWKALIDKYNILEEIRENGSFHIKASQIKQFKEPRLMAKWDSTDALPKVLKENKINILPDSRSSYVIGDFLLYQEIPELEEHVTQMAHIELPDMERIISLLENMYENPMTGQQIAELMDFEPRQSDYYYNAGKYLGLFKKISEDKQHVVVLTRLGNKVFKLNYKKRQLKLVELILEHQIFSVFFDRIIETGEMPDKQDIEEEMRALHVCGEGQTARRASSVYGWIKWIFHLTKL